MPLGRSDGARIELTIVLPNGCHLEQIDIRLIETIRSCHSISGAGRLLDISYRKTWRMVNALNLVFSSRVINTFPGRHDGGAEVTPFGERLVAVFRSMERRSNTATAAAMEELIASLNRDCIAEPAAETRSA